jgi:phospholipase C
VNEGVGIIDDNTKFKDINWKTLGEMLEEKNITWKVYQEQDNFGDNAFEWFEQFKNAKAGDPLYEKGLKRS